MTYVRMYINSWVLNLKWLMDSLAKVLRGYMGWSLHVLSMKMFRMTLVRAIGCYVWHDLNLGSFKDYLGNLEECAWASLLGVLK